MSPANRRAFSFVEVFADKRCALEFLPNRFGKIPDLIADRVGIIWLCLILQQGGINLFDPLLQGERSRNQ